jgi:hypothetical protein
MKDGSDKPTRYEHSVASSLLRREGHDTSILPLVPHPLKNALADVYAFLLRKAAERPHHKSTVPATGTVPTVVREADSLPRSPRKSAILASRKRPRRKARISRANGKSRGGS